MGINGLLPLLKSIQKPTNLKNFKGKTLAVDAYGWLHRGSITCAVDLAQEKPTKKYVEFAMSRIRMLLHYGVTPYIIFDGDYLPSKAKTEEERSLKRAASKKAGLELLKAGRVSAGHLELQKCVDVTPEMARKFIDELKDAGVKYIVAPYEADPQMVYLERHGIVDGILSEDSDLLVFGAQCLLTKLDQFGDCIEVNRKDFTACKAVTLTGWSDREFRSMAILSGCDYLSSINGMGLRTAYRLVRKHKNIENVVRMLRFDGKFSVPKEYLQSFQQAELTFLHQRVYDPRTYCIVHHTEPSRSLNEQEDLFIGGPVESEIATRVASGELHPMTKLPIHTDRSVLPRGKWHMSRPDLSSTSTSTIDQAAAPSNTINNYFKSKRISLQEKSSNVIVAPAPACDATAPVPPSVQSRRVSMPHAALSYPSARNYHSRTSLPVGNVTLEADSRPLKRARLCNEESDLQILERNTPETFGVSPFFHATWTAPTPTVSIAARYRTMDELVILDETFEEAVKVPLPPDGPTLSQASFLRGGPERKPQTLIKKYTKAADVPLEIWQDTLERVQQIEKDTETCSEFTPHITSIPGKDASHASLSAVHPSRSISIGTPSTQISVGLSKFALATPSSSQSGIRGPVAPRTLSASQHRSRIPSGLESLQGRTFNRSKLTSNTASRDTPPQTPFVGRAPVQSRRSPGFQVYQGPETTPTSLTPSVRRLVYEKMASVPLPKIGSRQIPDPKVSSSRPQGELFSVGKENSTICVQGSEDLIVADSEEEEASDSKDSPPTASLNLSRFAFRA